MLTLNGESLSRDSLTHRLSDSYRTKDTPSNIVKKYLNRKIKQPEPCHGCAHYHFCKISGESCTAFSLFSSRIHYDEHDKNPRSLKRNLRQSDARIRYGHLAI